ncbi:hypothetical protein WA026_020982 [Henosepilachna vigintioctopunctata]|uniref:ABC transporter domain-containing protein n=1 Tax=Henosepilachna vigintioctopunctata TaxID=420089 RepID=A0AAW1VA71_9CUCU
MFNFRYDRGFASLTFEHESFLFIVLKCRVMELYNSMNLLPPSITFCSLMTTKVLLLWKRSYRNIGQLNVVANNSFERVVILCIESLKMGAWNKFLLLMWKNWKLQRRRPISFLIELAIPLLITSVFVVIRSRVKRESYPVKVYDPFFIETPDLESIRAYTPDDNKFINELMTSFENAKPFADTKKMEEYLAGPNFENMSDYSLIGLQFEQQALQDLPKNITITIRCGSKYVDWHTGELYPPFGLELRNRESSTGGDPSYRSNFIQLMYMMTEKLLNKSGKAEKLPDMYLQRFPNSAYEHDNFLDIFSQGSFFALFFMAAFVYGCTNMTKSITNEKEKQLKISMKIMGLPTWLHWTAWFCKMMVPFLIIAIVMVVMFKWKTSMGAIFEHTNWLLLFIFFLLYVSCIITYSFALSVFFSKANRAGSIAGILWIISLTPYLVIRRGNYEKSNKTLKYLSSLSVTTAMAYGFDIITVYEVQLKGVHWGNLFSSNDQLNITFGGVLLMMCFNVFFYLLIAVYVEAIYPGEFGVPQKWYFFLTRNFWCKNIREDDEMLLNGINNQYFEEDPRNLKAGVKIRNLWKSFGPNYAVKGINLNIYEDQITVLLGHNGAGKTTTMSMLTAFGAAFLSFDGSEDFTVFAAFVAFSFSFSMRLSLTGVDVEIFACCFICPFLASLSRVVWVGNGNRFAMFDYIFPDEVDGVAFLTVEDVSSLVSIVADDVNGTGSMVTEDVDGARIIASDDVAVIGLTEVDAGITIDES